MVECWTSCHGGMLDGSCHGGMLDRSCHGGMLDRSCHGEMVDGSRRTHDGRGCHVIIGWPTFTDG